MEKNDLELDKTEPPSTKRPVLNSFRPEKGEKNRVRKFGGGEGEHMLD